MFQQQFSVFCPYCGEKIDIFVDDIVDTQSYYEDCSVCCNPILFNVSLDENGEIVIEPKRDDE